MNQGELKQGVLFQVKAIVKSTWVVFDVYGFASTSAGKAVFVVCKVDGKTFDTIPVNDCDRI